MVILCNGFDVEGVEEIISWVELFLFIIEIKKGFSLDEYGLFKKRKFWI